ncbi:Clp protease N-terminal domain-containing protein [Leifsonia aquatica]|uniref:Clp protease N-terminal domain-containing protein n=1 Tax=Leifsonia aquatica TaxID=144185 RepID=UPI00046AF42A|nr:Clp protease N-terminal domain-containing protein [Leifsonia aquatica]
MSEIPPGTANNAPGQPLSRAMREVVVRSVVEAQHRNAPLVEAEHLLLALTRDTESPVHDVLVSAGLDTAGVEAALQAERELSLRAAGVTPPDPARLVASPRVARPRWGASAKDALSRAHRVAAAQRRQRSAHADLLAALLGLDLGTVPRALELAGIDRAALLAGALRAG